MSETPQARLPVCLFCEESGDPPGERRVPYLAGIYEQANGQLVTMPFHLTCFIETIAGRVCTSMANLINTGEVDVGLDTTDERGHDRSLSDVVADIATRLVAKHL